MEDIEQIHEERLTSASASIRAYLENMAESIRVLRWVYKTLVDAEGRRFLMRMMAGMAVAMVFSLLPALLLGEVLAALVAHNLARVWWLVGAMAGSLVVAQLANMAHSRDRECALGHIMGSTDAKMSEFFFEKSVGQHVAESSKLNAANVEKARGRIWSVVDMLLFQGSASVLRLAISLVLLWTVSLTSGAIVSLLVAYYLATMFYMNRRVMEVCTPLDSQFRAHNRYRADRWEHVGRVKHAAKEREELVHMSQWFARILVDDRRFWLWYITVSNLQALARAFVVVGVLALAIWRVSRGDMEMSTLVPLFWWSLGIAENLWQIGMVERVVSWNMPSIQSMMHALTIPPDIVDASNAQPLPGAGPLAVEFCGVSYTYDSRERGTRPTLRNVSFAIRPGERVAIVGQSGAGKSTITSLLLRDRDPFAGTVRLNGVDVRLLCREHVLANIALIEQHPPVLDGTLRDNVVYALPSEERARLTDDDIWSVLERAQLADRERFTAGLDTRVGHAGVKLSGGEKQRLMIAAAVILHPRFIIIDEATSSLDVLIEKRVQQELQEMLSEGVTALVIAHRFSTIRYCDRIIVLRPVKDLRDGESQIEAMGTFEELLESSPTFRELAQLQRLADVPAA